VRPVVVSSLYVVVVRGVHSVVLVWGSFTYYQAQVGSDSTDLFVQVTPFSGDPDLYVNLGKTTFPNLTSYDRKSSHFGAVTDSVLFKAGQPPYCNNCLLNIGVWGYVNSFYAITFANL
jgi:hypothetical protein